MMTFLRPVLPDTERPPEQTPEPAERLAERSQVQTIPRMSPEEELVFRLLVLFTVGASIWYFLWWLHPDHIPNNWSFSQPWLNLAAGVLFFATLTVVVWTEFVQGFFLTWVISAMRVPLAMLPQRGLRVAMVTCFVPGKEPYDLLERTLTAMVSMRYPHDTWVLDEGGDPIVRAMCARLGVRHFTRFEKIQYNRPAGQFKARTKAGNHNAWRDLHEHQYDIVAQMDMDYAPHPSFLEKTLGYFRDPNVAFVGSPQIYANQDRSWIARGSAEQAFVFYGPMQMGLAGHGVQLFIGANHVYRTAALQSIGGYQGHIVEDHLTGMHLYAKGWKSVYLPEVLCTGEGPEDWKSYFSQQMRWAFGLIDILLRHSPRLLPRLSWPQRVAYFFLQQYYFHGIFQLLGLVLTSAYLLLGWEATRMQFGPWLLHAAPPFIGQLVLFRWLQRFYIDPKTESGWHLRGKLLMLAAWPIYAYAGFAAVLGKRLAYAVTPKGVAGHGKRVEDVAQFTIHAIIAAVSLVVMVGGFITGHAAPQIMFWAALTAAAQIALIILAAFDPRKPMPMVWKRALIAVPMLFVVVVMVLGGLRTYGPTGWFRWPVTTGSVVLPTVLSGHISYGFHDPSGTLPVAEIEHHFYDWSTRPEAFGGTVSGAAANGRTVVISWEPRWIRDSWDFEPTDYQLLESIARGEEDYHVGRVAESLRDSGVPMIMRFAHEMELPVSVGTHPWSGQPPENFITAHRRVVDLFRSRGATNVRWLWSPAGHLNPDGSYIGHAYYPGDDYVDYVGFSVYLAYQWEKELAPDRDPILNPRPPEFLIDWGVRQLDRYPKPIIIPEFGVQLHPSVAERRAEWLAEAGEIIASGRYPLLVAALYYNAPHGCGTCEPDWRLTLEEEKALRESLAGRGR